MLKKEIGRRSFLKGAFGVAGATALAGNFPAMIGAAEDTPVYMSNVIRTLSNEYHAAWNRGGRIFSESAGMGPYYSALLCEGDSEKQLTLMKAILTKGGSDVVFNIDPNQSPDAAPIAELCAEAGVYFLTQWNKPDDLHPWDFDPYWVAHMGVNGVPAGYDVAKELFEAMGGGGKIVALQGLLANVPAIQRFQGLQKAMEEYPDIELLAEQTAEWDRTKAVTVMEGWLTKFPEIDGVWAANDNMGLGALEVLRAEGLSGDVPVVGIDAVSEAVAATISGEFVATVSSDAMWQGGMGLSIPYHAYMGTFDPAAEPKEHREFYFQYILITPENAEQYWADTVQDIPQYDWEDLWGMVTEQITYPDAEA